MAITSKKGQEFLKSQGKKNVRKDKTDMLPGFTEPQVPTVNPYMDKAPSATNNSAFNIGKPQKETKSKRVNLVLQPSLYEKAQAVAKANGVSFNEMVTQLLQQVVTPPTEYADGTVRPDGEFKGQLSIDDVE